MKEGVIAVLVIGGIAMSAAVFMRLSTDDRDALGAKCSYILDHIEPQDRTPEDLKTLKKCLDIMIGR